LYFFENVAMQLIQDILNHAESLGAKGKVDMARLALKLGKRLDIATSADEERIRHFIKEIWGKDFVQDEERQ
jgi:hypothetical protein